jgi:hypothetical protein
LRRVLGIACAVAALCGAGVAKADDVLPPPPGLAEDDPTLRAKPNAGSDVVSALQLGSLLVLLEETSLGDIKELLGVGRIDRLAGHETGPAWVCYTIDAGPQPQRVWVSSNPLQNGFAAFEITALALTKGEAVPSDACPKLMVDPARLSLDDGVWLGRTTGEVQRKIGADAKHSGLYLLYEHERPLSGGRLVDTRLVLEFREGRVIGLWARKSTRS